MFSFTASFLAVALLAISQFYGVASAPANSLDLKARASEARSLATAPYWVTYSDSWTGSDAPPDVSKLSGFNTFILAFYLSGPGAFDNVKAWTTLTDSQRTTIKSQYAAAGISLMASAFGATDTPCSSGVDPIAIANKLGDFVIKYQLDGIDIDFEDFGAWNSGTAVPWLIKLTKQLRTKLPQGQYLISHAPVAPWFAPNLWLAGGYLAIDKSVGSLIDFYNLQFYSQAPTEYVTCDGLLNKANQYPGSAVFEIAASGVPMEKLVIGKPATPASARDFMDPSAFATCLQQAKAKGWNAGAMVWEYPDGGSQWITTARSLSWPVGQNAPAPPPTTTSTPPAKQPLTTSSPPSTTTTDDSCSAPLPSTTTSPASPPATTSSTSNPPAGCGSVPAWSSTSIYTSGKTVSYNGHKYTAQWWTQGDDPSQSGQWGVWRDAGSC